MSTLATSAPTAARMMVRLSPMRSVTGPLMRNENPYVSVPKK